MACRGHLVLCAAVSERAWHGCPQGGKTAHVGRFWGALRGLVDVMRGLHRYGTAPSRLLLWVRLRYFTITFTDLVPAFTTYTPAGRLTVASVTLPYVAIWVPSIA